MQGRMKKKTKKKNQLRMILGLQTDDRLDGSPAN